MRRYAYTTPKRLLVLVALLLLVALALPAMAQEDGEGGIIITSAFGSGPDTLSQIYCTGTDCDLLVDFMFADLLEANPDTATIEPNAQGSVAESWEVSDDNLVYTFTLRDNLTWTDGTPITADNVVYEWEVMNSPEAAHPQAWILDAIADVVALDDYTLQVTMLEPSCSALSFIGGLNPLPSHILRQYEISELANLDFNLAPSVTSGEFVFGEFRPAEAGTLLGYDDYFDAPLGYVAPDGLIQIVSADQTVEVEALLQGEINVLDNPPVNRRSDIRAAGDIQVYDYPGNTWDYFAFNTADPNNPQPALDENGEHIDQGIHPVFGDKLVRQALAHAVDMNAVIDGAVFGEGARMTAHLTPGSWAYNTELPPRAYDPELALSMLEEAGWVPNDDGRLVCQGCLYATEVDSSFEGSEFEFDLMTNAGNSRREAVGTIIQDQLDEIGITVNFQTIEFNTLLDVRNTQTYDAVIAGFRAGYPDEPDTVQLFGAEADVPGSGFNFTSFYNERFFELEQQALSVPGCDPAERVPLYWEMQEIMQDEMPYLWLYVQNGMYAAREEVEGFGPKPSQLWWNVTTWTVDSQ